MVITIAIAIIFALFVGYGIEVFNFTPEVNDYCADNLYTLQDNETCLDSGGEWTTEKYRPAPEIGLENGPYGYCNPPKECYDDFNSARNKSDKIVFISAIIIGLLAVVLGIVLRRDAISTGILTGGLLVILYGTIRYWSQANTILKFTLLGVVLAALIWLAYKKIDKKM